VPCAQAGEAGGGHSSALQAGREVEGGAAGAHVGLEAIAFEVPPRHGDPHQLAWGGGGARL
jgi:hypothetical protein